MYRLQVEGTETGRKEHSTYNKALTEARRLANKYDKQVHVHKTLSGGIAAIVKPNSHARLYKFKLEEKVKYITGNAQYYIATNVYNKRVLVETVHKTHYPYPEDEDRLISLDKVPSKLPPGEYTINAEDLNILPTGLKVFTNCPIKFKYDYNKETNMNNTIKKVFKTDEYQLVERINSEFGHEFNSNTFQNELDLTRDKAKYVKELERREKVREVEAKK